MTSFSTKFIDKRLIINFLFSSLIVSFIAGNLVLNLNLILFIVASIFFFKKKIFKFDLDLIDKILIFLFSYALIWGALKNIQYYNDGSAQDFVVLIKSVFYLRFLIFYFVIKFLIRENIINFKFFFIISFVSVLFVCFDLIFQLLMGYDIFGYEANPRRLSGPFGEELIAGSFIQRFSLISLFLVPVFFNFKKNYIKYIFTILLVSLILISLILAGNRIPLFFFILTVIGIIIFEQKFRKFFLPFILIAFVILLNLGDTYQNHLNSFNQKALRILLPFSSQNLVSNEEIEKSDIHQFYIYEYNGKKYKLANSHLKEFKTGYMTWLDHKFFGGGIKSFKINCPKAKTINCGSHPHNYYLEILSSLGLFGFFIFLVLFLILFKKTFIDKYFRKSDLNNFHLITPFIFVFFAEIFPVKSTGSFFSTSNATYIFLLLAIIAQLSKGKKLFE